MVYEIEWSEDAIDDFEKIVTYLEQKWSEEIAADFAIRVSKVIDLLQKMPFATRWFPKREMCEDA